VWQYKVRLQHDSLVQIWNEKTNAGAGAKWKHTGTMQFWVKNIYLHTCLASEYHYYKIGNSYGHTGNDSCETGKSIHKMDDYNHDISFT
jgi:hypothetical protein